MRISDWSSDVCSSDLDHFAIKLDIGTLDRERYRLAETGSSITHHPRQCREQRVDFLHPGPRDGVAHLGDGERQPFERRIDQRIGIGVVAQTAGKLVARQHRSEEHTSELQSLMRISYAVFCLKKKKHITQDHTTS